MIDIKIIRENPEIIKEGLKKRNSKFNLDEIILLDGDYRKVLKENEDIKAKRNKITDDISKNPAKKNELLPEMQQLKQSIKDAEEKLKKFDGLFFDKLLYIPNMPDGTVPVGMSPADNKVARQSGEIKKSGFEPLDHQTLGEGLKIFDFAAAAKLSGSRFALLKNEGAKLERALINFMLDFHLKHHGYSEVFPPFLVNSDSMRGTGQLPKMAEDMYYIEKDELYPIPTAEVPITNIYRNEIINENELPIKHVGYSACFRREAGSYGKESKGFLRVHQFNKVEMVKLVKPENSYDELEKLVKDAEDILQALKIPYRILLLCTGDLSFAAAKCYDIETWSPAENRWLESSSCSNFENFQARRANIRFKNGLTKKPEFVHTLNGSGLATSRLMVSLLEMYQTPEGKVIVPEVLQNYTNFNVID